MKTKLLTLTICIVALFSVDLAYGRYPVSPYAYVSNNPVNKVDPDGRDEFYFNRNGEMVQRIQNDLPDTFFNRDVQTKAVYTKTFDRNGNAVIEKSFETTTTNTQIDLGSDLGHMIRTVYAEAGGTNAETMLAVAEVIRNRAEDTSPNSASKGWAAVFSNVNTYAEVVTQPGKFQSVGNNVPAYSNPESMTRPNGRRNEIETNAFVNSVGASINATKQHTNTAQGAIYFYSPYIKVPAWTNSVQQVVIPNVSNDVMLFYKYK